jgi:DNA-binding beta-propeller fold protein YncE
LRRLESEFGDALAVIGVHSPKFPAERKTRNVLQAVLRHDVEHPVVSDPEMIVWQAYGVSAWPTLMFVDPAGRVFGMHAGEFDYPAMRDAVASILAAYRLDGLLEPRPLPLRPLPEAGGALRFPGKVLADGAGERLFVADSGHHQIVVAHLDGTIVRRIGSGAAGFEDGPAETATFRHPQGMTLSPDGRTLYVADAGNHALRAIDLAQATVRVLAGTGRRGRLSSGGAGLETSLASPWDLAWHGGRVWIAMAGMHQVWTWDPASEIAEPVAGTGAESIHDGPLQEATFAQPMGIAAVDGRLYLADSESSAVRQVDPVADRVRRVVGRGLFHFGDLDARGDSVRLQHAQGIDGVRGSGEPVLYLADTYNSKVKRLDPRTRAATTLAGTGEPGFADGNADDAAFWEPQGVSLLGEILFVADTNNHALRRLDLASGEVVTLIQ